MEAATEARKWDATPVPMDKWGKDHFSTLAYVESINVDGNGEPESVHLRSKSGAPRRGRVSHVARTVAPKDYPTVLRDGSKLHGHDDWDCVDDMVTEGLIEWLGTGMAPVLRLTDRGWRLAAAVRKHLGKTGASGKRTYKGFNAADHLVPKPSAQAVQRSQEGIAGGEFTQEELLAIANDMRQLVSAFYWSCFRAGMGTRCHPFLEFNGIMGKYVDLCRDAAESGYAFPAANTHAGVALPMAAHDVDYFAEKFNCIFGPYFQTNPEMAQRFVDGLLRGKS